MENISDILLILAQYTAMQTSAKRYHWQYKFLFGDHLMFDRVADEYDKDLVDKVVEQYYMGTNRELIGETNYIVSLSTKFEAPILPCNNLSDVNNMVLALRSQVKTLMDSMNEVKTGNRGIDSVLDEISSHVTNAFGLLNGRVGDKMDAVQDELTTVKSFLVKNLK